MAIEPGTVIAKRYRVIRQLGKGGMGEVFSAENTRTGRMVALKVLRAERDWSQAHLAEVLGVSRQTVNALETGRYDPSLPLAFKIARIFEQPIESIFSE